MDGATAAFAGLRPDIDAKLITVINYRRNILRNASAFRRVLKDLRPDLLVTSNWGTIDWAAANIGIGIPHVHMEDGFGPDESELQFTRRILARRALLRRSIIVVPSLTLLSVARDIWQLPKKRIIYVANGVDCSRFRSAPDAGLAARLGIASDRAVIGSVAPLRREKNLLRLLDAFADVLRQRRAQLVLVGDGPERHPLEARAVERGIEKHVIFPGFCATPESLLGAFSVVAISSDTEQMPLSLLEAMAAGRPVAATDVGDVRHMVAEENQPFVVQRSANELAGAIIRLLDDPARAAAIGAANARRASEKFDQHRMFDAYGQLFG